MGSYTNHWSSGAHFAEIEKNTSPKQLQKACDLRLWTMLFGKSSKHILLDAGEFNGDFHPIPWDHHNPPKIHEPNLLEIRQLRVDILADLVMPLGRENVHQRLSFP